MLWWWPLLHQVPASCWCNLWTLAFSFYTLPEQKTLPHCRQDNNADLIVNNTDHHARTHTHTPLIICCSSSPAVVRDGAVVPPPFDYLSRLKNHSNLLTVPVPISCWDARTAVYLAFFCPVSRTMFHADYLGQPWTLVNFVVLTSARCSTFVVANNDDDMVHTVTIFLFHS
jgi:hypothetical protein